MATTFKNAYLGGNGTLYTCPSATTALVTMIQASALSASYALTGYFNDSSTGNANKIFNALPIPTAGAIGLFAGSLVLEAGDTLSFTGGSDISIIASITELT